MNHETICAIATLSGGALGVVRISGEKAIESADTLFTAASGKSLQECAAHSLHFGIVRNEKGEIIDEVLLSLFRSPHSYTGEDSVEISCHGSAYILQQIMQLLIRQGCRQAEPGEFTQRAFLNGKMDLSQAEAVADLIAARSATANQLAIKQMRGGISNELSQLRDILLQFSALIELELDFGEEDVQFANREQLMENAERIRQKLIRLCESFQWGNAIKNGIPVAIIGETNAGKSTLLNFLLNEEKAIVSDIHGTTRDSIEDTVSLQGINFRFIDTAGLRDTQDRIEQLGIERSYQKIDQAAIVLWMIDSTGVSERIHWMAERILPRVKDKKLLLLFNKSDKITTEEQAFIDGIFASFPGEKIHLSAKFHQNTDRLQNTLIEMAQMPDLQPDETIISSLRHYEALQKALEAIHRVISGLQQGISADFIAQDIRECTHHIGLITGHICSEDILKIIFSRFCVGK